jgi:hypothetical protein
MKSIILAAGVAASLCGPAFAQSSQSNSGSNATVNTLSGSQSIAIPRVDVNGTTIGNGASSSTSGARAVSNTSSASRAGAVGNTTNVTITDYTGGDPSGGGSGSGARGGRGTGGGRGTTGAGGTTGGRSTSAGASDPASGGSTTGDPAAGLGTGSLNYGGYTIRQQRGFSQ